VSAFEAVGLGIAAFVAGAINAVAGGGTLVSFPALLAAGYPGVTANVTNTVAIWPGTVGGSLAYLPELRDQRARILVLGATSIVGAILGSIILLVSPEALFDDLAPWLILFACLMLALQTRLGRWVQGRQEAERRGNLGVGLISAQLVAAMYGAYFGAGLGIVMLAFLGIFLPDALQRVNALKGVLALIINGVAAVAFGVFGPVVWSAALLMAVTSWFGGYFGVRVARRLSATVLRTVVLFFGVTVALTMIIE
jgi:hypothetical protein